MIDLLKTVEPIDFSGWNMSIMQLFGKGPMMTVMCGNCHLTFKDRIMMVDDPILKCPYCEALNKLPLQVESQA